MPAKLGSDKELFDVEMELDDPLELAKELENDHRELIQSVEEASKKLHCLADDIDELFKKCNRGKIAGSAVSLVGFPLIALGFGLSFVTFGTSLGLSIAGAILSGAGGMAAAGSGIAEHIVTKEKCKEAQEAVNDVNKRAEAYNESLERLRGKFPSSNIFSAAADSSSMVSKVASSVGISVLNGIRLTAGVADDAAATVFRGLGTVLRVLHIGGFLISSLLVPYDIYTLASSSVKEHRRSPQANKIRDLAREMHRWAQKAKLLLDETSVSNKKCNRGQRCKNLNTELETGSDTSRETLASLPPDTMPGTLADAKCGAHVNRRTSRDKINSCIGQMSSGATAQHSLHTQSEKTPAKLYQNVLSNFQRESDSGYTSLCDTLSASYNGNSSRDKSIPVVLKTAVLRREALDPKSQIAYPQLCKHILNVCEQVDLSKENDWSPVDFRKVVYKSDDRSFGACIVSKEEGAQINVGLVKLYIPPESMPTDDLYLVYLYVEGDPRRGYNFRYGPHGLKLNHAAVISFPTDGYSIFQETNTSLHEQDKWVKSDMICVVDGGKKHVSLKHFSGGQDKSEQELQAAFNPTKTRTSLMGVIFGPEILQKDGNNIQVCLIRRGKFEDIKREKRCSVHPKCITNWSYYGTFDLKDITISVNSTTDYVSAVPQKIEIQKDGCFDDEWNFDICEANFTFTRLPEGGNKIEFTVSIQHEKDKAVQPVRVSLLYSGVDEPLSESNPRLDTKVTTLEGTIIKELQEKLAQDNRYIKLAEKNGLEHVLKQCTDERSTKEETIDTIFNIVYNGDAVKLSKIFKELRYDDCMKVLKKDKNYSHIFGGSGRSLVSGQSIESPSDQSSVSVEATDGN